MCGATSMGKSVEAELKEMLGDDVFSTLQKEKRLIKELW